MVILQAYTTPTAKAGSGLRAKDIWPPVSIEVINCTIFAEPCF
jgi:hypothetical protein